MRSAGRLRRWARRIAPKACILLYHRIANAPRDPQLLCVTPPHFAEHLEVLRRRYHPLSLRSLGRRLALNLWLPGSVVTTFDDGYADNLYEARPLLERFDVPATVFVAAGGLASGRAFWWDELEHIFLGPSPLPDRLALEVDGQAYSWGLRDEERHPSDSTWHVLMDAQLTPRQVAYKQLAALLRGMGESDRETVLTRLFTWAGMERKGWPGQRALSPEELQSLAHDGLVEIGAHTMSHPVLSALPPDAQRTEIVASRQNLQQILGHPVASFSYPFGSTSDYTAETVAIIQEAGFACACANFPGPVQWGTDRYQLPRFLVRDWGGDEFARRLEGWLAI